MFLCQRPQLASEAGRAGADSDVSARRHGYAAHSYGVATSSLATTPASCFS
jgi:hypothetical protein